MKYLCRLVILATCLTTALTANYCEVAGLTIPYGETKFGLAGDCALYTCDFAGNVSGKGCGEVEINNPARLKTYPECCPGFKPEDIKEWL